MTYLSEGQNFQIENIIKLGMVEHIIKSGMDNNQKFNIPSLRILGNLATGTNDHVEVYSFKYYQYYYNYLDFN